MEFSAYFLDKEFSPEEYVPEKEHNPFGQRGALRRKVMVCRDNQPVLLVHIFVDSDKDGYLLEQCFSEVLLNEQHIAILFGQHVHILDIASQQIRTVYLNDYVGHLYPLPDVNASVLSDTFLVATFEYVFLVDIHGKIIWQSKMCAIDGVIIDEVVDGVIYGSGEWDPPGGWEPFRLSLNDGTFIKP